MVLVKIIVQLNIRTIFNVSDDDEKKSTREITGRDCSFKGVFMESLTKRVTNSVTFEKDLKELR